jgi:ribosomal protein S12 methylthiotransferase
MNRPYGPEALTRLVREIRAVLPDAALRTTLMVGFPGEREEDVRELLDFLEANRFDHVGVFAYENEEGSVSAGLPDHCDERVKEERRRRVMELQSRISAERLQRFVGRVEKVLVEGLSKETDLLLEGRTRYQAPEIDGCVYITSGATRPGALVDVMITEAHAYDLVGEMVESR